MSQTDLSKYDNRWYKPGNIISRALWYLVNATFFKSSFPFCSVKVFLLKMFGAKIGSGVIIKPSVNIKYPWLLEIGDHTWIGERAWIDNLAQVKIGKNVCLSQGAMLLTGNHNYKRITFDLTVSAITLADGVWIGAKSIVCPGVSCGSHAVLAVGSVATSDLLEYSIYSGNPAQKIKDRTIE